MSTLLKDPTQQIWQIYRNIQVCNTALICNQMAHCQAVIAHAGFQCLEKLFSLS